MYEFTIIFSIWDWPIFSSEIYMKIYEGISYLPILFWNIKKNFIFLFFFLLFLWMLWMQYRISYMLNTCQRYILPFASGAVFLGIFSFCFSMVKACLRFCVWEIDYLIFYREVLVLSFQAWFPLTEAVSLSSILLLIFLSQESITDRNGLFGNYHFKF